MAVEQGFLFYSQVENCVDQVSKQTAILNNLKTFNLLRIFWWI